MRKVLVTVVTLMIVAAAVVWAASNQFKPSPQSLSGVAVAFAKADIGTGDLLSFGGKGTTEATITDRNPTSGEIQVTFTGKYPKNITKDNIILNATHESSSTFGVVADAFAYEASPTQIVIIVGEWETDTLAAVADRVFLTVYVGQSI